MKSLILATLATAVSAAGGRYVMYFDQYHTANLPDKSLTAGITHVITAFAASSLFTTSPGGVYEPFMNLSTIRGMFDPNTKLCMAIGGWGDTSGFGNGSATDSSRKLFAKNVADTINRLGYDCLDVDWEYPGGNGQDYRQTPNSAKVPEIAAYPLLLAELKAAIGKKELSIAVPGLSRDMIAYTPQLVPKINAAVDFVNVMTYDLMNRRDTQTLHHTSLNGSLEAVETYISMGMKPSKLNLGFAFYAKFFTTADGVTCTKPVGCATVLLEAADGSDTGKSGAMTFEKANFASPTNLTVSPDASCGANTRYKCPAGSCCSQYGFCGSTAAHCGAGCQFDYSDSCKGVNTIGSFKKALAGGIYDEAMGGQWYWDADSKLFWTWDTPEIMARKMSEIVAKYGLGGIMAWSLAEDSMDWSRLKAMQSGFKKYFKNGNCKL